MFKTVFHGEDKINENKIFTIYIGYRNIYNSRFPGVSNVRIGFSEANALNRFGER